MTTEEGRTILEDLLVGGLEDWAHMAFVYDVCMYEGETDPET